MCPEKSTTDSKENASTDVEPPRHGECAYRAIIGASDRAESESRASSIDPYSSGSEDESEDELPDAEPNISYVLEEYIVTLEDETTREQFDAIIQDAKNHGESPNVAPTS